MGAVQCCERKVIPVFLHPPPLCYLAVDCGRSSKVQRACAVMHVPVVRRPAPFHGMGVGKCQECGGHYVPDILMCTIDRPRKLVTTGPGELLEVHVVRKLGERCELLPPSALSRARVAHPFPCMRSDAWSNALPAGMVERPPVCPCQKS